MQIEDKNVIYKYIANHIRSGAKEELEEMKEMSDHSHDTW